MAKYYFEVTVKREIEDTLTVFVDTNKNKEAAKHTAMHVAQRFPRKAEDGLEARSCYLEHRDFRNSEVVDIQPVRPINGEAV